MKREGSLRFNYMIPVPSSCLKYFDFNKGVYESIMTGLQDALDDSITEKPILKRHKITVLPVKVYKAEEIKKTRNETGMSQKTLPVIWVC